MVWIIKNAVYFYRNYVSSHLPMKSILCDLLSWNVKKIFLKCDSRSINSALVSSITRFLKLYCLSAHAFYTRIRSYDHYLFSKEFNKKKLIIVIKFNFSSIHIHKLWHDWFPNTWLILTVSLAILFTVLPWFSGIELVSAHTVIHREPLGLISK